MFEAEGGHELLEEEVGAEDCEAADQGVLEVFEC